MPRMAPAAVRTSTRADGALIVAAMGVNRNWKRPSRPSSYSSVVAPLGAVASVMKSPLIASRASSAIEE
ncbi:MAG: hypothetical protein BWX69_01389 [Planctomycetes bacterium ADurb.Bin069]|nr:MAG: hypothetical protein BWX69_01389 [Planctomycetes bacterium ADurb.Bin069]